ncbi:treslin [Rhineura floridana]|uniref:treslin n=1 Tax=Rhineura floridana TaxID=261503 RepID=UPI002AC88675|nr:treslin [Rhineura floridana]XP_061451900.1 treslin [Rhineura floridana]
MTCSHNVVFLLDTASSVQKIHLHLATLRILNYLGCKFGLTKIRWGFKFFDSLGVQGRTSRVGNFRELGSRSWEDFEEELEARFGNLGGSPNSSGSVPRATLTRNILKESLLDYQWDRPEIASPAKPVLRSQKSKLTVTPDKPLGSSTPSAGFVNAIFLFSPCPHSQRELLQFVSGMHAHSSDELPASHDLTEKFLPKGIREMMASQKITLYWVDTAEQFKLLETSDHIGYWMLVDLMRLSGGTILPSDTLIQCLNHHRTRGTPAFPVESGASGPPFTPWAAILPFDSTLNCLFSSPSALQVSFPRLEGVLFLRSDGVKEAQSCGVMLEPLTVGQRHFRSPVNISLKCAMTGWNAVHVGSFHTESWVLQSPSSGLSVQETSLFQQFVKCILAQGLHMVAEVCPSGACSPYTGIFTPISDTAAVLSLLCAERAPEVERSLLPTVMEGNLSKDEDFNLPEVVSSVVNQVDGDWDLASPETLFPEWAQQELTCTQSWSPAVIEDWYCLSNLCGASSRLMESLRLLQAGSATEKEAPKPERELTRCLSKLYQKKASDLSATSQQQDHRKRRGVPRTPVRQKMKTMPRSLQMLNTARLNVKAQKFQPDGELLLSERVSQKLLLRRLDDKVEERGEMRKPKIGFRTEEEMLSFICTNYQKAVIDGQNLFACAQDTVTAVNTLQKSNEAACVDTIRSSLLKTSKALRQQLGNHPDKEINVRECQLQVYLRLEMCLQCPSLQSNTDRMEQLVEEMTEMLRILCLTKDPGYLARFLEEVVETYLESMPKTLGDLYYSLGTQIPPKLASVLPADFFSDDSISQESQTTSLPASASSVPVPRTASLSTDAEQLEELRTRSAKKRKNMLARHRSVTEASQNVRQIEIPQVPKHHTRKDNSRACLDVRSAPAVQKMTVQETTKVRRNLFNEGKRSLTKIPRSQSVSVLEGLKNTQNRVNECTRDNLKLLTKSVAETPLHKQISRRLLHKQIKGRSSNPESEVDIVEESPEKTLNCGLRRSPRIKQLLQDRMLSGPFHCLPPNKNVQQVQSVHLEVPGLATPVKKAIQSPKSLLFGAVHDVLSSAGRDSPRTRRKSVASSELVHQTPRKTSLRSSQRLFSPPHNTPARSPWEKIQHTPRKTPAPKHTAAKSLENLFSPRRQKSKSLPEPSEKKGDCLAQTALLKERFSSPYKPAQLQTERKQERDEVLDDVFVSPASGSNSADVLVVTCPPSPGKALSELQSPRRSLRVAQKIASPASTQKQTLEAKQVTDPESHLPLELNSMLSEVRPTIFQGELSEESLSPKNAKCTEAFSPQVHSALLPAVSSPPCNPSLNAIAACTLSPAGTRELNGSPLKPQSVTNISPTKAPQSPSCPPEEHWSRYRNEEEHHCSTISSLFAKTNPFCKAEITENKSLVRRQAHRVMTPSKRSVERHLPPEFSTKDHVLFPDAIVVCERLDPYSLISESVTGSSQEEQGPDSLQDRVLPGEKATGLQHLLFQSPSRCDQVSLPATPKSGSCAYALRHTPDRRQREAAARLGKPEKMATFSAPWTAHALPSATSPPTYEVELEMQASGLPKLRIKRVGSGPALEPQPGKPKSVESDPATGDLSMSCCSRHSGKPESVSISPSCNRSAQSTPGKLGSGGQTYICQSYTPTRCISYTASPPQGNAGIRWTPSPKNKGKVTPEAIKAWPRRKRATAGCSKSERHMDSAGETPACDAGGTRTSECLSGSKALLLGDFELEGVYRLQDQSPCSDAEPSGDESICRGMSGLKFRKRPFDHMSPEEEGSQEVKKRHCPKRENPDVAVYSAELLSTGKGMVSLNKTILEEEEVFCFSGLTPPNSSGKSMISSTGLLALTQSPLLYQGHTTSLRKCRTGDTTDAFGSVNEDLSPFHSAAIRQQSVRRTYSRKRLLS